MFICRVMRCCAGPCSTQRAAHLNKKILDVGCGKRLREPIGWRLFAGQSLIDGRIHRVTVVGQLVDVLEAIAKR